MRGIEAKDRELLSHVCIPSIMTTETKKGMLDDTVINVVFLVGKGSCSPFIILVFSLLQ